MTLDTTITLKRRHETLDVESSPRKLRRTRVPSFSNLASSIERPNTQDELADRVFQHAGERIHTLATLFHAYDRKWVRSDGTLRPINVKVGRAKMQVGMGTRNEHAAHSNPCSGIRDNYFKQVANDLRIEQKITPITNKVLSRALNPETKEAVKTLDFSDYSIKKHIPSSSSLIDNSILTLLLNGTHVLPTAVNLQVDSPLEKLVIRPLVENLLEKVGVGTMTPKEALTQSKDVIEKFYKSRIEKLKNFNADEKLIQYTELELQGTQAQDLELLDKYLFNEFYDQDSSLVDFDKTLRLLEYQDWKKV